MDYRILIEIVENWVKSKISNNELIYNFDHINRVRKMTLIIARSYSLYFTEGDLFLIEISSLIYSVVNRNSDKKESDIQTLINELFKEPIQLEYKWMGIVEKKSWNPLSDIEIDIIHNIVYSIYRNDISYEKKMNELFPDYKTNRIEIFINIILDSIHIDMLGAIGISRYLTIECKQTNDLKNDNHFINHIKNSMNSISKIKTSCGMTYAMKRIQIMKDFIDSLSDEINFKQIEQINV